MKVTQIRENVEQGDFTSIYDLTSWLKAKGINSAFSTRSLSSQSEDTGFHGVPYDEAMHMLTTGWQVESEKLRTMLQTSELRAKPKRSPQFGLGVVGYAPIVPLALAGVPQNMVTKVLKVGRDKVITVNKSISYHCGISTREIERESAKALALVRRLEQCGYSVNLNVVWGARCSGIKQEYIWKVRVKNANERLNLSKVSFPMVNPAMLRRIMFSVMEKWDGMPMRYTDSYGSPMADTKLESMLGNREVLLPAFIHQRLMDIRDVDELANSLNIR